MMDSCKACRLPLERNRTQYRRIGGEDYCQVCFELYDLVANKEWFVYAQGEYNAEVKRIKRLRSDGKYLSD